MAAKKNQTVEEYLFDQITERGLGEDEPSVLALWNPETEEYEDLVEVSVKPRQQRRSITFEWSPVDETDDED